MSGKAHKKLHDTLDGPETDPLDGFSTASPPVDFLDRILGQMPPTQAYQFHVVVPHFIPESAYVKGLNFGDLGSKKVDELRAIITGIGAKIPPRMGREWMIEFIHQNRHMFA